MLLWDALRTSWVSQVVRWNLNGVKWREFTAIELLWMFHNDQIVTRRENSPSTMRRYLTDTADHAALAWWDNQSIKDKAERGGNLDGH